MNQWNKTEHSSIMCTVDVEGETVDIIKFYNSVFIGAVRKDSQCRESSLQLNPVLRY